MDTGATIMDDTKPKDRRSVGAVSTMPLAEGEATVVRRQPEELTRKHAEDRVFGERKKSTFTATQLRGVSIDANLNLPSVDEMAQGCAADAKRAHEARLAEFDRMHEHWIGKQQACVVPKEYDGVKLNLPLIGESDVTALIRSFTNPYADPHCLRVTGRSLKLAVRTRTLETREPAKLHQRYMYDLILNILRQWECPPSGFCGQRACSVMDLPDPAQGSRMLIVGDTHGQLADVLWIFAECASITSQFVPFACNVPILAADQEGWFALSGRWVAIEEEYIPFQW